MSMGRAARRPLVVTLASSTVIQGLSVVTGVVLARALGPEQRGELGVIILWPSVVAAVVVLGLPEAVAVLTAARAMSLVDAIRAAMPIIVALAIAGVIAAAAIVLGLTTDLPAEVRSAAVTYVVFIPINMLTLTFVGALTGAHRFGVVNAVRISVVLVAAVGLPLLAVAGLLSVWTAVATYIAANLIALGISFLAVRSAIARSSRMVRARMAARQLVGYGVRAHAGVVAGMIGERLDQLVISAFLLPRQYGLYLAAIAVSTATSIVSTSITTVLVPTVAADVPGRRLASVRRYLKLTALLTAVIAIATAFAAPAVLTLLFGTAFREAVIPAQVLLVGTVPLALSRALGAASRAAGRPGVASRAEWLSLILAVPAYAVALPAAGLVGAAFASVLAYSGSLLFQALAARAALGARSIGDLVRPGRWESATTDPTAAVS